MMASSNVRFTSALLACKNEDGLQLNRTATIGNAKVKTIRRAQDAKRRTCRLCLFVRVHVAFTKFAPTSRSRYACQVQRCRPASLVDALLWMPNKPWFLIPLKIPTNVMVSFPWFHSVVRTDLVTIHMNSHWTFRGTMQLRAKRQRLSACGRQEDVRIHGLLALPHDLDVRPQANPQGTH